MDQSRIDWNFNCRIHILQVERKTKGLVQHEPGLYSGWGFLTSQCAHVEQALLIKLSLGHFTKQLCEAQSI